MATILYVPRTMGGTLILQVTPPTPPAINAQFTARKGTATFTARKGTIIFTARKP